MQVYKVKGYEIPGVIDPTTGTSLKYLESFNGLGSANLTRGGTIMPRWRANASIGYPVDAHRLNLRANYVDAFGDDTAFKPISISTSAVSTPRRSGRTWKCVSRC